MSGEENTHMNASWMLVGLVYMMCVMYVVAAAESLTQENTGGHRGAASDLSVDCLKELHPSDCLSPSCTD